MARARSSAHRSATSATTTIMDGSRRASMHTAHGFCVSILPHTRQISIFSMAACKAAASGAISNSRFLIRNKAARRAERGPSPGSRANSAIRRSISGPAAMVGITGFLFFSLSPWGRGIGGLRPPFLTGRTPMRSIGYGEGVRPLGQSPLTPTLSPLGRGSAHALARSKLLPVRFRPQLEALNFAGRGFRQLGAEFEPARIFVGGELLLAVILQGAREGVARLVRRFEHHERLGLDQPVVVGPADHGGFEHVGVALQHALDLERRHIHAGDLEHVVAPAAVDEVAVVVLDIFVARARPFAEKGAARLLAIVPIHHRAGRSTHLQLTHLAGFGNDITVVIDQTEVVAGERLAAGAIFHVTR